MLYTVSVMSSTSSLSDVNNLATQTVHSVWSSASDFLIILILLVAFFLFAYYVGRGPLVGLLLSFYAAYAFYRAFPFLDSLPSAPASTALWANVGLYTAFVFVFYVILRRVVVSDFLYIGVFGLIALSFLGSAFLIALAYHVFPVADIYTFTPAIATLFSPAKFFFWWFISPAVGLFFLAR